MVRTSAFIVAILTGRSGAGTIKPGRWSVTSATAAPANCFAAIVYMARTSTPWRLLPVGELGCGSEATVRHRLVEWSNADVFERLHDQLLDRLGAQGLVDWSRASLDTMSVRAKRVDHVGANPVDRGKPGSKLHLMMDGQGLPLVPAVTAANVNDGVLLVAMVDDLPKVATPAGRRRSRPASCTPTRTTAPTCGSVGSPPACPAWSGALDHPWSASLEGRAVA
jgi:transposase